MFPVFTTFKLERERDDVLFVAASGLFGDIFNPFLVSDSAQKGVRRGFMQVLDCIYIDLLFCYILNPVNTRKAFVCENFGAFLFLFVISTFASAGDIWKHNKNKNLTK